MYVNNDFLDYSHYSFTGKVIQVLKPHGIYSFTSITFVIEAWYYVSMVLNWTTPPHTHTHIYLR